MAFRLFGSGSWRDREPVMPATSVTDLSDDNAEPVKPKAKSKPKAAPKKKTKPAAKEEIEEPAEDEEPLSMKRPAAKNKKKVKGSTGEGEAEDEEREPMKRPSGKREEAEEAEEEEEEPVKRPAKRPKKEEKATVEKKAVRAYKYKYHRNGMWGVKYKGKELLTVGVLGLQPLAQLNVELSRVGAFNAGQAERVPKRRAGGRDRRRGPR